MRNKTYIVVCAVAALGLSLTSPEAASAFPAAAGTGKAYTQTVSGTASTPVRWGGHGGWGGGRGIAFRGGGWGGRGWGASGIGYGRGIGWGGGWRGAGWRGGYGGWGGNGWGWGWPVGLGLGVAAATTYPAWGGYYSGPYGGYGGCSCGGW